MPLKSKAQMRLAYASAAGTARDGMPKKVAQEFISATSKQAKRDLPEKASGKKQVVLKKKGGK